MALCYLFKVGRRRPLPFSTPLSLPQAIDGVMPYLPFVMPLADSNNNNIIDNLCSAESHREG